MGQSCDTLHFPQILERDIEVITVALLHLNLLLPYLCVFSSTLLCCSLLQELQDRYSLTCLPLILFFLFPYLPQV